MKDEKYLVRELREQLALAEADKNGLAEQLNALLRSHTQWYNSARGLEAENMTLKSRLDDAKEDLCEMQDKYYCAEGQLTSCKDQMDRINDAADRDASRLTDLRQQAVRASAELRHAFKAKDDWNLVARAIEILEKAVPPLP